MGSSEADWAAPVEVDAFGEDAKGGADDVLRLADRARLRVLRKDMRWGSWGWVFVWFFYCYL